MHFSWQTNENSVLQETISYTLYFTNWPISLEKFQNRGETTAADEHQPKAETFQDQTKELR